MSFTGELIPLIFSPHITSGSQHILGFIALMQYFYIVIK